MPTLLAFTVPGLGLELLTVGSACPWARRAGSLHVILGLHLAGMANNFPGDFPGCDPPGSDLVGNRYH